MAKANTLLDCDILLKKTQKSPSVSLRQQFSGWRNSLEQRRALNDFLLKRREICCPYQLRFRWCSFIETWLVNQSDFQPSLWRLKGINVFSTSQLMEAGNSLCKKKMFPCTMMQKRRNHLNLVWRPFETRFFNGWGKRGRDVFFFWATSEHNFE